MKRRMKDSQFCPQCGVKSLVRDLYRKDHGTNRSDGRNSFSHSPVEFVCSTCGFAFQLRASLRLEQANQYFARDRKLRPSNWPKRLDLPMSTRNMGIRMVTWTCPSGHHHRYRPIARLCASIWSSHP